MEDRGDENVGLEGFEPVGDKDRAHVINYALNHQGPVYFKHQQSIVYKTHVVSINSKKIITCERPENLPIVLNSKEITLNFVIDQEIYFITTVMTMDANYVYFAVDREMFHLVRRKNRRIKIPKETEALVMIKKLSGQMAFLRALVIDISKGGCRLTLGMDHPLVCLNDMIEGSLRVGERTPVDIKGQVRYHKLVADGPHRQTFGIQFMDLTEFADTNVAALVMDVQRELFLKMLG